MATKKISKGSNRSREIHNKESQRAKAVKALKRRIIFTLVVLAVGLGAGVWISYSLFSPKSNGGVVKKSATESVAQANQLYGIDISSNDEDFRADIDKAQDFVICRVTCNYGVDAIFDEAYNYAKSEGKLLGVYFWGNPVTCNPKEYASFCAGISIAKGYVGEALIALDFEQKIGTDDPVKSEWAMLWMDEFEKLTGVKPVIYMNSDTARDLDWSSAIFQGYQLWVADYGVDDGGNYGVPEGVAEWTSLLTMHQYTTCGNGERESLDLDVFYGNDLKWGELAVIKSTGAP